MNTSTQWVTRKKRKKSNEILQLKNKIHCPYKSIDTKCMLCLFSAGPFCDRVECMECIKYLIVYYLSFCCSKMCVHWVAIFGKEKCHFCLNLLLHFRFRFYFPRSCSTRASCVTNKKTSNFFVCINLVLKPVNLN